MPELRKDPIIGRWVIIATERGKRPSDFGREDETRRGGFCPFCPGNEDKTPPEVLAYREPGEPSNSENWWVRCVPNKFPALSPEADLIREGEGMYDKMSGVGAHEVIIETPDHNATIPSFDLEHMREIVWAYRERLVALKKDERFRYILLFKNHGQAAGASLEHPHTQIIALPIVPKRVQEMMEGAERYYDYKERCVFCDIYKQEQMAQSRIVFENDHFLVFEPFAPRFPFETWLLPKRHASQFDAVTKDEVPALAEALRTGVAKINKALSNPPYNFVLHQAPVDEGELAHYHWHIEIMPKLTHVAGFEWGSGFYINPTPPEAAAKYLREA